MKDFIKTATKHTAVFGLGDILNKLIGFILLPIYLRYLSVADYGILELLSVISTLTGMIILQGIPTASFKGICHTYLNDKDAQKEVVGTSYLYLFLSSLCFFGFCFFLSPQISKLIFSEGDYLYFVRLILITSFFTTINNIPFVIFRAKLQSFRAITVSVSRFTINALLKIYFVVFLHKGVEGILLGELIATFILFIVTPIIIWKEIKWKLSYSKLKPMLAYGWPLIPGAISGWILSSSDRYFLEYFSMRAELGIYALAFKLSVIINFIFLAPFLKVWPSLFFPIADQNDAPHVLGKFSTYFWGVGSVLCLSIVLMSQPLISIIAPDGYGEACLVVPILCTAFLLDGFQQILNVGILIKGKTRFAPLILICGTILNVIFNILLIPRYGMYGASIATFISSFTMVILAYYLNRIFFPIHYEVRRIAHLAFLLLLFIVIDQIFPYKYYIDAVSWKIYFKDVLVLVTIKLFLFFMFPIAMLLTGLFKIEELEEVQKYFGRTPLVGRMIGKLIDSKKIKYLVAKSY